jgi:hypothetical protein
MEPGNENGELDSAPLDPIDAYERGWRQQERQCTPMEPGDGWKILLIIAIGAAALVGMVYLSIKLG